MLIRLPVDIIPKREKKNEPSLILVSRGVEDTKADLPVSFFHGYPCEWVARVSRMRERETERREVDDRKWTVVERRALKPFRCIIGGARDATSEGGGSFSN